MSDDRPTIELLTVAPEAGIVTISSEHWSWRRWRWERVA